MTAPARTECEGTSNRLYSWRNCYEGGNNEAKLKGALSFFAPNGERRGYICELTSIEVGGRGELLELAVGLVL